MKKSLKNLDFEDAIKKEWIITNGLGGFASSTIIGANTRKYHGLLVAPLNPPAQRYLLVSKVDESINIDEKVYGLYTNMCRNNISDGYKNLVSFEKEEVPVFTYNIDGIQIEKTICMEYRKNISIILYKVKNKDKKITLNLTPLLNYRDFHSLNYNKNFYIEQKIDKNLVDVVIDNCEHHIYMNCSDGKYVKKENDLFSGMYYIEEEKRGFSNEENHAIAGSYEIEINPNEEKYITFACSLDEIKIDRKDGKKIIQNEKKRIKQLIDKSDLSGDEDLIKKYIISTDNFIVSRKNLLTLIAGYPWFLDWGRDTFIAFEGTVLKNKRFDVARKLLLTFTKDIKQGLVPNGYSELDNKPLYNSVDSSLLLFEQVKKYINYTGDYTFIKEKIYDKLKDIIENYTKGIDLDNNNIYLDEDFLISAGTLSTQNTWMDAKIGDYVVTPRNGKQVEINSLWYNALMVMCELGKKFEDDKEIISEYRKLAKKAKESFNEKFYNKKSKCLYDVINDDNNDAKIRPNQLYAIALSYPVIDSKSDIAKEILNTATKKLLNNYGLKTLAKGEVHYTEVYEGDQYRRDISYHQGITWPWLLGLYNDAFVNIIKAEKDKELKRNLKEDYKKFVEKVKKTFTKEINDGKSIGSISELYDSKKPYEAKGAFAQCWSVSEVFRIII
ncbi:MAG: glycogen debranching enzyme N-terminal domain-containing protein [Clostridia bacterium]|nr:glycogen debranching enzyme N-terminal domain-containing protein [Clostridia bacterium]